MGEIFIKRGCSMKRFFKGDKRNKKLRNAHGYTMAEVLMVVAILGILAAISFMGVFAMRRNMTQTKADKNAELIFEAAQRQLVSMVAFDSDGTMSFASKTRANGLQEPVGLDVLNVDNFNMLLNANPGSTPADDTLQALLLKDQVSDDLYNKGWIVEYDNTSLQVKSVFYFEDGAYTDFYTDSSTNQNLRASRANRLNYQKEHGKVVGYYDGSTSSIKTNELKVTGSLKIENKEELIANAGIVVTGKEPANQKYKMYITTTGKSSDAKVTQVVEFSSSDLTVDPWTKKKTVSVSIVLDSLKDKKQFKDTYGSITSDGVNFLKDMANGYVSVNGITSTLTVDYDTTETYTSTDFIPGEDVLITLKVQTEDGAINDTVSDETNSLYAAKLDDAGSYVAYIEYGRHLQNLDTATSALDLDDFATIAANKVTYNDMVAIQRASIYFAKLEDDTDSEWLKVYETPQKKFVPIKNTYLKSYTGGTKVGEYVISDLICDTTKKANAGLFAEFSGDKIEFVTLINERIKGSSATANGAIGGLVGKVSGSASKKVEITGCRAYMNDTLTALGMAGTNGAKNNWMNHAKNIGGLIGESNRTLEISYCSAANVITDATNAGGLVGVGKKVVLERSYADCYLGGKNVGGLVASCDATSTIRGCYSAGFIVDAAQTSGGKVAGITPCEVASIKDAYTVFHFGEKAGYDGTQNFYPTVAKTTEKANVYYIPANFDIPLANKVGVDRSIKNMKDKTYTGFAAGYFAFRTDTEYGRNTSPYKLIDYTSQLQAYHYPMLILDDENTLDHYGDWYDTLRNLNIRFLYSDQAVELKNAGVVALADPLQEAYKKDNGDSVYYFTEDSANAIVAHQKIQEYSNAFIPQQNYQLPGREKTVLYWQFTYEGNEYFYVPDREDSYTPAGNRKRYIGKIYLASDCEANIQAGNVAPWHGITPVEMDNPLESVTQSMDVYARFYVTDQIQFIRMHYRIFEDSTRNLSTALGRYVGRANIVKNVAGGTVTYTANAAAHANIGGYHFYGWATTETGYDENNNSTILLSSEATEESQRLLITLSAIEKGDLYAIYERINSYQVNVEYCVYDSTSEGWGPTIAQPQYNTYSTEDWMGDKEYTRKISLPRSDEVSGYDLRKYDGEDAYKALYFDANGNRNPSMDTGVVYDTNTYSSFVDALNAGEAYINIDIRQGGTYVVTYKGLDSRQYRVYKHYLKTVSSGAGYAYSDTEEKVEAGTVYDDGVVGGTISADKVTPDDDGFELDHYGTNATPVIANIPGGGVYECHVFYKRKQYELFYDLNGGVYDNKGYHTYDAVEFGKPLTSAGFIATANTTNLIMSGCDFGGWTYYKYEEFAEANTYTGLTAYTASSMPKEAVIAVAQWHISASTPVRLEIYRQDRTNALSGTSFDDLAVPNENKTYLLQKSLDITTVVNTVERKEALLNASTHSALINTMKGYGTSISNNYGTDGTEINRLLNGAETQYYFTDALTTNSTLSWANLKPELENGVLVVRLYYDRAVVTANLRYGDASNDTYAQNTIAQAQTNSATESRIITGVGSYGLRIWGGNISTVWGNNYRYVSMKGLYGSHFDEPPYVWTDEYFFLIGTSSTGKRHLDSFIDEDGGIGGARGNAQTTWNFYYYSTNGNRNVNVYLETSDGSGPVNLQIGGTGDIHNYNAVANYTFKQDNNTNNYFSAGTYHGYTLWAKNLDGGELSTARDGDSYNNQNVANNFYFIRKSGFKILCDGTVGSAGGAAVANNTLFDNLTYGDTIVLPAADSVSRTTDNDKYTFGGWYATSDCSGTPITQVTMDDRDMQVFAKWIPKNITITYHPSYPDATDVGADIVQNTFFSQATGDLKGLSASDNGRISTVGDSVFYTYTPAGDDHASVYRFDGWWRKDANENYTVRLTGNEVLYDDNTDVYARWTQVEGYAYLKYRCIMVDDTSIEHTEMSTTKILLGSPQYVYAPLVNGWGAEWAGYYPTQTRVKETFTGEEPEVIFYYSKGTALQYSVSYKVTFRPYGETAGEAEEILLKTQDYVRSVTSAVVLPPNLNGYILTSANSSVTVDADYIAANPDGVLFAYEPDISTIRMEAKTIYGTHQSFPDILMDDVESIFGIYTDALSEYELVPMYYISDLDGNDITPAYVTKDMLTTYLTNVANGTYRAKGQVRLQKNGTDVLTLWESDNYINFTMISDD